MRVRGAERIEEWRKANPLDVSHFEQASKHEATKLLRRTSVLDTPVSKWSRKRREKEEKSGGGRGAGRGAGRSSGNSCLAGGGRAAFGVENSVAPGAHAGTGALDPDMLQRGLRRHGQGYSFI